MKEIGARLKEERERLRMTQPEFAASGGVQKNAQIKYEKGERAPDAAYLSALVGIGVDALYVLTGQRVPPPGQYEPDRDFGLLAQCIDAADAAIAEAGLLVATEQRSRLYLGLYGVCATQGGFNPALVGPMLSLLAQAQARPSKP